MFLVGDTLSLAHASYPNIRPHFVPSSADSSLFAALCEADSGSGECTFPSTVVLADNLACHGNVECNADTLHAIKLVDPITSTVVYYEYIDPPCVRLAFFDDGQTTQYSYGKQCADPTVASITGVACCSNATKAVLSNGGGECLYIAEATTYSTAEERCAALYTNGDDAGVVCPKFNHNSNPTMEQGASLASQAGCSDYQYHWTDESCQLKAQIDPSGHVNLIEDIPEDEDIREDLQPGAGNPFPVRWNAPTGASELTDGAQFPLMTATPIVFTPKFEHLTTDIQCATADGQVLLADSAENVEKCARLCSLQTGCTYFIFADPAGSKAGECHMEAVDSDDCGVGGTVADEFSLYKILSKGRKRKQQGISGVHKLSVNSCTAGCSPQGAQGACICPIEIETSAVYKDAAASLPPLARLRETLKEGALNPIAYGSGVYTQCDSAACTSQPGVAVYTVGSSSTPTEYDERTIFEFTDAPHDYYGQKRSRFLINRISTVFVGNRTLGFNFRNPPGFMPNAGEETRGHGSNWNSERSPFGHSERKLPHAQYETDALINHLHEHDNTAPFVAYRLIQRLTSSNPSPRYIKVVADAFATGSYEDLAFSGSYGDLKATVTAILLDREARSSTLDIDPTHGMIREPLLKVLHMMRSMEFQTTGKLEVMLHAIHNKIGQNAFQSPSVFNFYLPEFAPSGKIAERGLVAPESQLAITPLIIGYLNGMDSLIDFGLTKCRLGFGDTADGSCNQMYSFAEEADGAFSFKPSQASTPAAAVQELANLLTGGRLSSQTRAALEDVYETVLGSYPIDVSSAIATQSSTLWSRYAKRAIDMDGDRFSSCSYTGDHELEPPQSPWFELDLKTVHAVQTIVLTGARANTYGQARLNGMDVYLFTTERRTENIYEQRGSSGSWIGECTCPDGQTYNVGDQWNSCDSLECNGGVVTKACDITTNWQSPGAGYGVWCAPASTTNGSSPERPAQLLNTGTLCGSEVEVVDGQVTTRVHCHGASGNMIRIETPADPAGENGLEICDIEVHVLDKNASGVYLPAVEEKEALALKQTLKLISMAPEFHSTNENNYGATPSPRTKPPNVPSQNRPYKAVVVVFLEGGADSYNMLVPHSNCEKQAEGEDVAEGEMESYELYDDYKELRSEAMALTKAQLLQVTVNGTEQPCQTFGLHPDLDVVRDLYLDGDAALIANAGALVEPVTGAGYRSRYQHPINLPPSLFAHNIMQRSARTVHAADASAKGVLGKMVKALSTNVSQPMKSALYSLAGFDRMLEGAPISPYMIDKTDGVVQYQGYKGLQKEINAMLATESTSLFAETFAEKLEASLDSTEDLGAKIGVATLDTAFDTDSLSEQLHQVAKLIKVDVSPETKMERSAFLTRIGGWDTHADYDIGQQVSALNAALTSFVNEMKAQSLWQDVAIVCVSDFGRTLTSNTQGSDHGWGGNYFVLGGNVNGGQMLGKFPERLVEEHEPLNVGRGRLIPTTPWESIWQGVGEWWGLTSEQLADVLPHAANFVDEAENVDMLFGNNRLFNA